MAARKSLILTTSLVCLAILLSFYFFLLKTGSIQLTAFNSKLYDLFSVKSGPSFANYDGMYVEGSLVRKNIAKYGNSYFIKLQTVQNPISFVITSSVDDTRVLTDYNFSKGYENITDPDSLYYVDNSSLFMTTVLYENKEVVGVYYSQKDSGELTSKAAEAFLKSPDRAYDDKALVEARSNYYSMLEDCYENMASSSYLKNLSTTIQSNIQSLQQDINSIKIESQQKSSDIVEAQSKYEKRLQDYNNSIAGINSAWESMIDKYNQLNKDGQLGGDVIGHADIKFGADSSLNESLEFWNSKFNGGD